MKKIDGKERNLRSLLQNQQYTIPYYQREYRWGKKQILELLSDLSEEFLANYTQGDERKAVKNYGCYFLGSVIRTNPEIGNSIIDGQQRLTSITLLLIYLNNLQRSRTDKVPVDSLIYSESYGEKSFNLFIDERVECLNALYNDDDENFDTNNKSESVKTLYDRYQDIKNNLDEELTKEPLPYFMDWLIDNVYFVDIEAYTEQDAHKIFLTMNDRGLSLTPAEMLKGYLLSNIKDDDKRNDANTLWKEKIQTLNQNNDGINAKLSEEFFKNWFRAQYAQTIRDTKKGAVPKDFDLIGTEFHKWAHENNRELGLNNNADYTKFVLEVFPKYADLYIQLMDASANFSKKYEYVFYNAKRDFTLQYQLILAAVSKDDPSEIIDKKIQLVSRFIDIYITNRVVNYKSVNYSTIKNSMFNLTKKIRNTDVKTLRTILINELNNMEYQITAFPYFGLNNFTSRYVRHILARMTNFIEMECDVAQTSFETYINGNRNNGYDIEHIIADNYEIVKDYFDSEIDFRDTRNKIGNLILLPADKNRSIQDLPYEEKLDTYAGDNILAKSFCKCFYSNNPRFKRWIEENKIGFEPLDAFDKQSITSRQKIYEDVAKLIWNSDLLKEI